MRKALILGLALLWPAGASAGPVSVRFELGFVTVSAQSASLREVLSEWARQGQTRFVNAERIPSAGPVTLELTHVPEKQALEVLLRSASGYVAAPRAMGAPGASSYDRVLIMPTSSGVQAGPVPPRTAPRPPVFTPPVQPPMPPDDQEPTNVAAPGTPGGEVTEDTDDQPTSPQFPTFPGPAGQQPPQEGMQPVPGDPNATPAAPAPVEPGPSPVQPGVVTMPSPGQIPTPQPQQKPPQ